MQTTVAENTSDHIVITRAVMIIWTASHHFTSY